jgi:hypothetical protein
MEGRFRLVTPDEELVVIFGALHVVALAFGVLLFVLFLRSDSRDGSNPSDEDEGGGGGGSDRISDRPKTSPSGGIPLPDAEPAPVRLRGHQRLADLRPRPARRRVAEPAPARRRVHT